MAVEKGWVGAAEEITTDLSYLVLPKALRRVLTPQKIDAARRFIERSVREETHARAV